MNISPIQFKQFKFNLGSYEEEEEELILSMIKLGENFEENGWRFKFFYLSMYILKTTPADAFIYLVLSTTNRKTLLLVGKFYKEN